MVSVADNITFVWQVFDHGIYFLFDEKGRHRCAIFSVHLDRILFLLNVNLGCNYLRGPETEQRFYTTPGLPEALHLVLALKVFILLSSF